MAESQPAQSPAPPLSPGDEHLCEKGIYSAVAMLAGEVEVAAESHPEICDEIKLRRAALNEKESVENELALAEAYAKLSAAHLDSRCRTICARLFEGHAAKVQELAEDRYVDFYYLVGRSQLADEQASDALTCFDRVVKRIPDDDVARIRQVELSRTRALVLLERHVEAAEKLATVLGLSATEEQAMYTKVWCKHNLDEKTEKFFAPVWDKYTEKHPNIESLTGKFYAVIDASMDKIRSAQKNKTESSSALKLFALMTDWRFIAGSLGVFVAIGSALAAGS